jgi:hypothetical protein
MMDVICEYMLIAYITGASLEDVDNTLFELSVYGDNDGHHHHHIEEIDNIIYLILKDNGNMHIDDATGARANLKSVLEVMKDITPGMEYNIVLQVCEPNWIIVGDD